MLIWNLNHVVHLLVQVSLLSCRHRRPFSRERSCNVILLLISGEIDNDLRPKICSAMSNRLVNSWATVMLLLTLLVVSLSTWKGLRYIFVGYDLRCHTCELRVWTSWTSGYSNVPHLFIDWPYRPSSTLLHAWIAVATIRFRQIRVLWIVTVDWVVPSMWGYHNVLASLEPFQCYLWVDTFLQCTLLSVLIHSTE